MKEHLFSRRYFLKAAVATAASILLEKIGERVTFAWWPDEDVINTPRPRPTPTSIPTPSPEKPSSSSIQEIQEVKAPLAPIYRHGNRSLPLVALTVDDAWHLDCVRKILDIAKARGVKLTFFPAGRMIDANHALWRQAFEEGHEIENHTYSHSQLTQLSPEDILREVDQAQAALDRALGIRVPMKFIRPPKMAGFTSTEGVIWVRETIAKRGLGIALWDVDSKSTRQYGRIDANEVFRVVANGVQSGSIILQHFIPTDVEAFPMILDEVTRRGLKPVTLSELLKRSGYLS